MTTVVYLAVFPARLVLNLGDGSAPVTITTGVQSIERLVVSLAQSEPLEPGRPGWLTAGTMMEPDPDTGAPSCRAVLRDIAGHPLTLKLFASDGQLVGVAEIEPALALMLASELVNGARRRFVAQRVERGPQAATVFELFPQPPEAA
jgi:hypothetical protein